MCHDLKSRVYRRWRNMEVDSSVFEWEKWESHNYLQVKNDRTRAGERLVTAGHALHSDREGAISTSTVILTSKKAFAWLVVSFKGQAKKDGGIFSPLPCLVSPLQRCTDSAHQSGTIWNQSFGSGRCHKLDTSQDKARLRSATDPEHRNYKMQYTSLMHHGLIGFSYQLAGKQL